jgi:hypothetical protein
MLVFILRPFGIFYGYLVYFWSYGIVRGDLQYFFGMLFQEKSGNAVSQLLFVLSQDYETGTFLDAVKMLNPALALLPVFFLLLPIRAFLLIQKVKALPCQINGLLAHVHLHDTRMDSRSAKTTRENALTFASNAKCRHICNVARL